MNGGQLLVGLPATGKSTFLAALWYLAEREDVESALSVKRLGQDDEHLNELSSLWLQCKTVERSLQAGQPVVSMMLEDKETNEVATLFFPDLAGETHERHWVDRECESSYVDLAKQADGVLLFIHPQRIREADRIEDYLENVQDANPLDAGKVVAKPRKPDTDPTAVILVDLIQMLMRPPLGKNTLRVAVVVSAWDLVVKQQRGDGVTKMTPKKWMAQRLPLLIQFMRANFECLTYKVYGVSAQGGSYDDEDEKRRLLSVDPSKRVQLVEEGHECSDLTLLVKWLMTR